MLSRYLKRAITAKPFITGCMPVQSYIAKDAGVQLSGSPAPYRTRARAEKKGINIFGIIIFLDCGRSAFRHKNRQINAPLAIAFVVERWARRRRRFQRRVWRFWRWRKRRRRSRPRFLVRPQFQKRSALKLVSRTIPLCGAKANAMRDNYPAKQGYDTIQQVCELFSKCVLGFIPVTN